MRWREMWLVNKVLLVLNVIVWSAVACAFLRMVFESVAAGQEPGFEYTPQSQVAHLPGPANIEQLQTWGRQAELTTALVRDDGQPWTAVGRLATGTYFRPTLDQDDIWQVVSPITLHQEPMSVQARVDIEVGIRPPGVWRGGKWEGSEWVYVVSVPGGLLRGIRPLTPVRPVERARVQVRVQGTAE